MKNLLLLLVLSFFSVQGFAAGCPDGSEPVKSISADGTYFVFNCNGGSNGASESVNSSSISSGAIKKNFEIDKNSSHALQFKDLHVDRNGIRNIKSGYPSAIAYLDLDGDGDTDIFMSDLRKRPEVYLNNGNDSFIFESSFFKNLPIIEHPRKAITGDFNNDGREDIYMANHGLDYVPFDGEPPSLVLSSKNGYTFKTLKDFSGFQHGAASADIDSDGDIDIVGFITSSSIKSNIGLMILKNDGNGNFTADRTQLKALHGSSDRWSLNCYTDELVDVDQDGYVDLLLGCIRNGAHGTEIFWGNNKGKFSSSNKTLIPGVYGYTKPIDIDVGDINNDGHKDIILNLTGSEDGNGLYVGYYIQVLQNTGNRKFNELTSIVSGPQDKWFDWIRLADVNDDGSLDILVDDAKRNLIWINSGSGSFTRKREVEGDYIDGKKAGEWNSWHKNGQKKSEENYKQGELDGKFASWSESGQILSDGMYVKGKQDGKWTTWFKNGQIKSEIFFNNGQKSGQFTSWNKWGNKEISGPYLDGKRNGKWTAWHKDGQLKSESNYEDGEKEGKSTTWLVNGNISLEEVFEKGKKSGSTKYSYWSKNIKKSIESHKLRKKNGTWSKWYKTGQKESEINYKDDKEDGKFIIWFENGQKKSELNYKDGELDGSLMTWDQNGKVLLEFIYKNGNCVGGDC